MAAPAHVPPFDPLIDLNGLWTPGLADRYLPIDGAPPARYEAVEGKLIMSPREGSANSWATKRLLIMMDEQVSAAGHALYSALNVQLRSNTWIEPDLVVLVEPVKRLTWVPANKVLMPIEFVSPSSRRRDRIDKPRLTAEVGIPYYLRVEIDDQRDSAEMHLFELAGREYRPVASALAGERFSIDVPFAVDLDPADLLEP